MAIKRSCTFTAVIRTPEDPNNYEKILITFSQDQNIIVEKTESDVTLSSNAISVTLTQEDTQNFKPSIKSPMGARTSSPAYMQIRVYKNDEDAPGSECWAIDVYDSLNDEVLYSE